MEDTNQIKLVQRFNRPYFILLFPSELLILILNLMWTWDLFFESRPMDYILGVCLLGLLAIPTFLVFRVIIPRSLVADDSAITYREWMKETISIPIGDIRTIEVVKPSIPYTSYRIKHEIHVSIISDSTTLLLKGDPLNIDYYSLVQFMKDFMMAIDLSHVECRYPGDQEGMY